MVVMIREVHLIDAPVRAQHHDTVAVVAVTVTVTVTRRFGLLLDGRLC